MAAGTDRSMAYAARHAGLHAVDPAVADALAKQIGFYATMKEAPRR